MKPSISSLTLADKLGTDHRTLVRMLCDMVSEGTLDKKVLPTTMSGNLKPEKETRLSLSDVVALAVRQQLPREVTDSIMVIFERTTRSKAPLVSTHVNHGPLADVLGDEALKQAIQQLRDETGDSQQIARDFGIRIVGNELWVGTSTPYMAKAAKKGSLAPGQLTAMLCDIDGAVRHETKKFGGHNSKVVAMPIDEFLWALEEGNPTNGNPQ